VWRWWRVRRKRRRSIIALLIKTMNYNVNIDKYKTYY
jgi:hypothetical protein